eukprot:2221778-Prymnesium_polylepis.1
MSNLNFRSDAVAATSAIVRSVHPASTTITSNAAPSLEQPSASTSRHRWMVLASLKAGMTTEID